MSSTTHAHEDHHAAPWLDWVARVGIAAGGMLYLLIGALALVGAFDPAEHPSGSNGAMSKLAHLPLGPVLLALLAVGLGAYVLWQLMLTAMDTEFDGKRGGLWRIVAVIQHLSSAALHCALVGLAAWQLLGFGHGGHGNQAQRHLTALALRLPGGRWLVGGVGAGIVVFALAQWVLACRPQKDTRMDLTATPLRVPILVLLVLGYLARGALFGLIGVFVVHAAWRHDPDNATGISGALQSMRHHPYGPWLLGAVAIGLIAFGLAQIAKARYRRSRIA